MLTTLAAALSLAASLAIEVPYLPQTDALCGGAAAAMVFRYWGDAHADLQDFAPLIDRRAGGIAADVLIAAVKSRGWRVGRVEASIEALGARLREGQPAIALLPDRGNRYHYVVVTAVTEDSVVVHDPAWGPSRPIRNAEFKRAWSAAAFWSLVILPDPAQLHLPRSPGSLTHDLAPAAGGSAVDDAVCDARLNAALDAIRVQGFDSADALLADVRAQCPAAIGAVRELSGVRFAQRRWSDAAALASEVL